ncbi:MAG: tRNA (adenosine(37)-N6)-threonylcarbamoyltransferase complex ATPase subunit type 1 TsaE [Trueperaceae bacterium]|nr:tRNA (adenosine(37)-N6)-threonylcarbamoyltransferase complex ATPase subunit type 1 TsaE [Trueperaceae bacterium]
MNGVRVLPDVAATRTFAGEVAARLPAGALLLLDGPLGAGKTTFVAALVEALGGPDRAASPTYTLVHEYPTPDGVVVHVDAYRLDGAAALNELGLDAYLDRARLVAVEWGGVLADAYPEAWRLTLARPGGADAARHATLTAPAG